MADKTDHDVLVSDSGQADESNLHEYLRVNARSTVENIILSDSVSALGWSGHVNSLHHMLYADVLVPGGSVRSTLHAKTNVMDSASCESM